MVDTRARDVFAHEALIRGTSGESAQSILSQVTDRNRYKFDQACRVKAIRTAVALKMPEYDPFAGVDTARRGIARKHDGT